MPLSLGSGGRRAIIAVIGAVRAEAWSHAERIPGELVAETTGLDAPEGPLPILPAAGLSVAQPLLEAALYYLAQIT